MLCAYATVPLANSPVAGIANQAPFATVIMQFVLAQPRLNKDAARPAWPGIFHFVDI